MYKTYYNSSSEEEEQEKPKETPRYSAKGKFEGTGSNRTKIYNVYITVRDGFNRRFNNNEPVGHCEFVRKDDGSVIYGFRWTHWKIENEFVEKFGTPDPNTLYALGRGQALIDGFGSSELKYLDRKFGQ
jgi:hypothetical protein